MNNESKKNVIENIKINLENKEFNKKVEVGDPNLSDEEVSRVLDKFYKHKNNKLLYKIKNKIANTIIDKVGKSVDVTVTGLDNIKDLNLDNGAIITMNHFNPLDSYNARRLANILNKELYIVIQDTNLAMDGKLGFLMNYMNSIPISKSPKYIIGTFTNELKKVLNDGSLVLIYPEEEMWFNYKLPRPPKRGAYQFAISLNVPIISCFVTMDEIKDSGNDEFNDVKYKMHVLKPIIPESNMSIKSGSIKLSEIDYVQKKECYSNYYQKKLDYKFSYSDIAGLKKY